MAWRLGLDLGANSLGWIALELDAEGRPCGILALGSRIFSDGRDPKSKQSLAVDRRDARAMRRRRDRYLQRRRALVAHLTRDGLFPANEADRRALVSKDPYELRARALTERLEPGEIARAIFHLNQRRGFQSNRKADRKSKDGKAEAGKVDTGIRTARSEIAAAEERAGAEPGSWTFGRWLHDRRESAKDRNAIPFVRTRMRAEPGDDKNDIYHFYPGRDLVKHEFDAIWEAQRDHHPDLLTQEVHDRLYEIVFHQRPLKEPKIGQCTLVEGEERLPKRHPLFQRRRLLEELNALMIVRPGEKAERLTPEQRDLLLGKLKGAKTFTFASMRKALKLDQAARFNKESENRKDIKGDEIAAVMGATKRFGSRWAAMPVDEQVDAIERIDAVQSEAQLAALHAWLGDRYGVDDATAKAIADAPLPQGFGRFGITATMRLIEALSTGRTPAGRLAAAPPIEPGRVVVYSEAADIAGFHHSDRRKSSEDGKPAIVELPYYGEALERHIMPGSGNSDHDDAERWGRITNPTVHIGLGQLRRVVNALIRAYGKPAEIALELARELKLSEDEKAERSRENARNRAEAQRRSRALTGEDADGNVVGVAIAEDNGANRARVKLWEELDPGNVLNRRCPYTGVQIGIEMLFSAEVEVDHILPFDATLDDSGANKTVCLTIANREKGKASPFQRWGHTDRWPEIAERAARMPRNKRWRFEPDAMDRFKEDGGFLARHLVDTQYLGRLAREYVETLYPEKGEDSKHVWVSPGRLTEMVRRKMGLNGILTDANIAGPDKPKNRLDHRHHTIDAFVVGIVDRAMLQRIATASGETGQDGAERIRIDEPWTGARDELRTALNAVTVSHRPDHGTIRRPGALDKAGRTIGDQTAGRLHNDTAYGFTGERDAKGNTIVVRRVPLSSIADAGRVAQIRDPVLRAELAEYTQGFTGKSFEAMIADFPKLGPLSYRGIRRVRIVEALSVIPIRDASGRAFKGYKGDSNYRYDVWELPDGKWTARVLSMFDAHQADERDRPHPAARRVVGLFRDDMLAIERTPGHRELVRVVKFSEKQFAVALPHEGGALKARDAAPGDPFKYVYPAPSTLKTWRARRAHVDELGRVTDPGFGTRKPPRPTRHRPPPPLAAE